MTPGIASHLSGEPLRQEVEVVIVGGGPAGLSAALALGRARRRVVVVDDAAPRHAAAEQIHGLLTQEGTSPRQFRVDSWRELEQFPNISRHHEKVVEVQLTSEGPMVLTCTGRSIRSRAVLIAIGVAEVLPDIPGMEECWGKLIHYCPHCHGWEVGGKSIGVLGRPPFDLHQLLLMRAWTEDLTFYANGQQLPPEVEEALARHKMNVELATIESVQAVDGSLEIELRNGRRRGCAGLFIPAQHRPLPLTESLGLALTDDVYIQVDQEQRTSKPGVWAAGDCASALQSVALSLGDGTRAAYSILSSLILPEAGSMAEPHPAAGTFTPAFPAELTT